MPSLNPTRVPREEVMEWRAIASAYLRDYIDTISVEAPEPKVERFRDYLEQAVRTPDRRRIEKAMQVSRRTLHRISTDAGFGNPHRWLRIARLLPFVIGCAMRPDVSLRAIATATGFPDQFTPSNQLRELAGARPSERLSWHDLAGAMLRTTFPALVPAPPAGGDEPCPGESHPSAREETV